MKKISSFVFLFLFLISVPAAFCLEVGVDIKGPQDLMALKDGIGKTITARCLARNITAPKGTALNVSITQLGDIISFDAILSAEPPKAFHRDLKSTGELSSAIDQMIAEIFTAAAAKPAAGKEPPVQADTAQAKPEYKFTFAATSMAVLDGTLFVSSEDKLYKVENGNAKSYWTPPRSASIYRLFPYDGSLLAVTVQGTAFFTHRIKDGKTVKSWEGCVAPLKNSLVRSRIYSDKDISDGINRWSKAETIEGAPLQIPDNTDILSVFMGDISSSADGEEIVSFDRVNRLVAFNGKKTVCVSDTNFSTLPFYLQDKIPTFHYTAQDNADVSEVNPVNRYHLRPRIVSQGKDIISFTNDEGLTKFIGNLKRYSGTQILACTPGESEFDERTLGTFKGYYCTDIALDKGGVLALIVKKSTSLIQRIDLQ
ncbi:MAG TPA: hypothetical protein PLF54_05465 [Deltaproteobacteria bacterium]|jgi:hypothetical protein|nr:hypothetical protein [Deltaproteobacteria bacterium]HQJ08429.1 hypothetical protein [Deltaproteobacteria bacterium]